MRVLIFHGYLLGGTGSNVYNARLAEALVRLGHEVHLFSQDRHPDSQPFVDAAGDWDAGRLQLRSWRGPVRCTSYRPNIGALLPVYVADRYEAMQARTFLECDDREIDGYLDANVRAVREVAERVRPDLALANHLIMGPVILARALTDAQAALGCEVPYAVKIHGSALEYVVKRDPERFLGLAREGLAPARTILTGSRHTAESLWAALGDPQLERRTRPGPPGVDVHRFTPRDPAEARAGLERLAGRLDTAAAAAAAERGGEQDADTFARDEGEAARAVARLARESGPLTVFVGKLIAAKGIDLLVAAWPLVLERHPDARLAIVGFGGWREQVQALCDTLAKGDLAEAEATALPHLHAFLAAMDEAARERYRVAARKLSTRVVFTGRLDHEELAELLPACEAMVVPSTFPESFGMVAVEAAACGALPISAGHSGLAEVSAALAEAVPAEVAPWLSFAVDDRAVAGIAERVCAWLSADPQLRARTRERLVAETRRHWSWEGVARTVIGAAQASGEGAGG